MDYAPGRFKGKRESRGEKGEIEIPLLTFGPSGAEEKPASRESARNKLSAQAP